jgi:ectoine hydroxylase-related dioxygenase (phytanoyl-CoA dioxygenase family)
LLRGLYPIFPVPDCAAYHPFQKAHTEAHPSQLITVSYLRDVEPGGGGLLIWPGSHRAIYPRMASKLEYIEADGYRGAFEEWTMKQPLELAGRSGDVIIIHHRLLHAPSVNRGNRVRFGFLCDYRSTDYRRLCG